MPKGLLKCLLMSLFISNIVTLSFSKTAFRESSHTISRLFEGFCRFLSFMYDQLEGESRDGESAAVV